MYGMPSTGRLHGRSGTAEALRERQENELVDESGFAAGTVVPGPPGPGFRRVRSPLRAGRRKEYGAGLQPPGGGSP